MQPSWRAAIGGDVVAAAHLSFVVLPPQGGSHLVKVLAIEADASEGILTVAQACKSQEDTLHAQAGVVEQHT